MFRKRKVLWYIDGTYMCNILIGSILTSIFDPNVMISYHNYAGDAPVSEMHWNVTACHIYVHAIDKLTMSERFSDFRAVVLNLVHFMYIFGDLRFTINLFLMFFFGIRKGTKESIVPWGLLRYCLYSTESEFDDFKISYC